MTRPGSGIIVPVPDAVAGTAIANTSVWGVPLSTVCEGPRRDHAHPVVTDWIVEYCSTSTYSLPEWAWLDVTIRGGHALQSLLG